MRRGRGGRGGAHEDKSYLRPTRSYERKARPPPTTSIAGGGEGEGGGSATPPGPTSGSITPTNSSQVLPRQLHGGVRGAVGALPPLDGVKRVDDADLELSDDDDDGGVRRRPSCGAAAPSDSWKGARRHTAADILTSTVPARRSTAQQHQQQQRRGGDGGATVCFKDDAQHAATYTSSSAAAAGRLERRASHGHVVNIVRSLQQERPQYGEDGCAWGFGEGQVPPREARWREAAEQANSGAYRRTRSDGVGLRREPNERMAPTPGWIGASACNSLTSSPSATPLESQLNKHVGAPRLSATSVDIRTDVRNQRAAAELAALERKLEARTQHSPQVVLQKRWLEAMCVMLAMRRFAIDGLGILGSRQREAAARSVISRLFVPLWRRHRTMRMAVAEKVIQLFIMRAVMRRRRRQRHAATDIIRTFLQTKMRYLRCVINWYVAKVRDAQRRFRLMMRRRDAQVELNFRYIRKVERDFYWQAVRERSVAASVRSQQQRLQQQQQRVGDGEVPGAQPLELSELVIPEFLLRRAIRKKITQRSREYHREVHRRRSSIRSLGSRAEVAIDTFRHGSLTSARMNELTSISDNNAAGRRTGSGRTIVPAFSRSECSSSISDAVAAHQSATGGAVRPVQSPVPHPPAESPLATSLAGTSINHRHHHHPPPQQPQQHQRPSLGELSRLGPTFGSAEGGPSVRSLQSPTSAFSIPIDDTVVTPLTDPLPARGQAAPVLEVLVPARVGSVGALGWRAQHAARLPQYTSILSLDDCFDILDEACLATGGLRGEPEWTAHLEGGARTRVSESFRFQRSSFRTTHAAEAAALLVGSQEQAAVTVPAAMAAGRAPRAAHSQHRHRHWRGSSGGTPSATPGSTPLVPPGSRTMDIAAAAAPFAPPEFGKLITEERE